MAKQRMGPIAADPVEVVKAMLRTPPHRCEVAQREAAAIRELIAHARKISPSPYMSVYVADLEAILGMDPPTRPHKLGAQDTE